MAKWKIKAPKLKLDTKSPVNLAKNVTPLGRIAGTASTIGATKGNVFDNPKTLLGAPANMWKNISPAARLYEGAKGLMGMFGKKDGGGGGGGGEAEAQPAQPDLTQKYLQAQEEQRLKNLEVGGQLTEQLRQQAMGEGPLAGAQLRAAQSRNLAQTLSAAQAGGATPLSTRQMLQQRGAQGRELAQLGQQERLGAQSALGAQIASQAGIGREDIQSAYGIGMTPAKMAHELQVQRELLQAKKDIAANEQRSQIYGGLISGAASIGGALASDENQKQAPSEQAPDEDAQRKSRQKKMADTIMGLEAPKNIGEGIANAGKIAAAAIRSKDLSSDERQKQSPLPNASSEVNDMMDSLEPKKYQYKNPELPGSAPGTRYGILAQDLEKSSLGKTLVKNTEHGKMVDTVQGFGAVLAAQAELNRRLKKLEKKGK